MLGLTGHLLPGSFLHFEAAFWNPAVPEVLLLQLFQRFCFSSCSRGSASPAVPELLLLQLVQSFWFQESSDLLEPESRQHQGAVVKKPRDVTAAEHRLDCPSSNQQQSRVSGFERGRRAAALMTDATAQ